MNRTCDNSIGVVEVDMEKPLAAHLRPFRLPSPYAEKHSTDQEIISESPQERVNSCGENRHSSPFSKLTLNLREM